MGATTKHGGSESTRHFSYAFNFLLGRGVFVRRSDYNAPHSVGTVED
jgi:hypothetical protein